MSLPPDEAAQALRDIEAAETRSRVAYGYLVGGSYLILWGVIWVVCYSLVDLRPGEIAWIWLAGCAVGVTGSVILGRQRHEHRSWRSVVIPLSYVVFTFTTLQILQPRNVREVSAVIALVVALAYVQAGILRWGDRIALIGAAVAALTLIGYWAIPLHFMLYMAIVGGGSLILAGVWLRRV
jgi:hypothetical protein